MVMMMMFHLDSIAATRPKDIMAINIIATCFIIASWTEKGSHLFVQPIIISIRNRLLASKCLSSRMAVVVINLPAWARILLLIRCCSCQSVRQLWYRQPIPQRPLRLTTITNPCPMMALWSNWMRQHHLLPRTIVNQRLDLPWRLQCPRRYKRYESDLPFCQSMIMTMMMINHFRLIKSICRNLCYHNSCSNCHRWWCPHNHPRIIITVKIINWLMMHDNDYRIRYIDFCETVFNCHLIIFGWYPDFGDSCNHRCCSKHHPLTMTTVMTIHHWISLAVIWRRLCGNRRIHHPLDCNNDSKNTNLVRRWSLQTTNHFPHYRYRYWYRSIWLVMTIVKIWPQAYCVQ